MSAVLFAARIGTANDSDCGPLMSDDPTIPSLILVAGTGRCGTLTVTRSLQEVDVDAEHEPSRHLIGTVAAFWPGGAIDDVEALRLLSGCQWHEVNAFYLYPVLLPLLQHRFPEARWLWVIRNAADTVASMVRHGWYRPEDDLPFPVTLLYPQDGVIFSSPPWHARPNAVICDGMPCREWELLPQAGRCAWWWDWVWRQMRQVECARYRIETQQPHLYHRALGFPDPKHWWVANMSDTRSEPDSDIVGWVDRFCAEGMAELYAGWDGKGRRPADG